MGYYLNLIYVVTKIIEIFIFLYELKNQIFRDRDGISIFIFPVWGLHCDVQKQMKLILS